MEGIIVMPSPERGRDFVLPLSMGGIKTRTLLQTGAQLLAEVTREPADCLILPETLPDGAADQWLTRIAAAAPQQRPLAVVLVYGVEAAESIRERVRAVYGPGVEVVAAGARTAEDVAGEITRVIEKLAHLLADQDRDAAQRLSQPVAPGAVPQPARQTGALAFVGASGGVGTSTLVANLGAYAAMAGLRTLLVDAHFATTGSLLYALGAEPDDAQHGIHHLRWANQTQPDLLQRLAPVQIRNIRHADLRVLHLPAILTYMVETPIDQCTWALQALERAFDLVLIDCGSGIGDPRTLKLLETASQVLLVTGGWGSGVHGLSRLLQAIETRPVGNLSRERAFLLLRELPESIYGTKTVSSAARMPIYGRIPDEPLLRKAEGRLGLRLPVVAEHPESPYTAAVGQVAYALGLVSKVETAAAGGQGRSWFGKLRRG